MLKSIFLCLLIPALHAQTATTDRIRAAATRSIAVLQQASAGFYKSQDCFSCHDHSLPAARSVGLLA